MVGSRSLLVNKGVLVKGQHDLGWKLILYSRRLSNNYQLVLGYKLLPFSF